jgi:hypothetical protein
VIRKENQVLAHLSARLYLGAAFLFREVDGISAADHHQPLSWWSVTFRNNKHALPTALLHSLANTTFHWKLRRDFSVRKLENAYLLGTMTPTSLFAIIASFAAFATALPGAQMHHYVDGIGMAGLARDAKLVMEPRDATTTTSKAAIPTPLPCDFSALTLQMENVPCPDSCGGNPWQCVCAYCR